MGPGSVIKETKSVCPECIEEIDAKIIEESGSVWMEKKCQKHGEFKALVSKFAPFYEELARYKKKLNPKDRLFQTREYSIYLTLRCNMNCPICLANANYDEYEEPSMEFIKESISDLKNAHVSLFGGEPTMREDLPEIIRAVKKSGNAPMLFTNGIKIADYGYLKELKDAGLGLVTVPIEGFDKRSNEPIRGQTDLELKLKALENLKKLGITTNLPMLVNRGINEKEMSKLLQYAAENDFVKHISFHSAVPLGRFYVAPEKTIVRDELIDLLEKQTNGLVSKQKVLEFTKLADAFGSLMPSRQMCVNSAAMMFIRTDEGLKTANEYLGLDRMQEKLERFADLKNKESRLAAAYLFAAFAPNALNPKLMPVYSTAIRTYINSRIGKLARSISLSKKTFTASFGLRCNPNTVDMQELKHCAIGEVSTTNNRKMNWCESNLMRVKASKKSSRTGLALSK